MTRTAVLPLRAHDLASLPIGFQNWFRSVDAVLRNAVTLTQGTAPDAYPDPAAGTYDQTQMQAVIDLLNALVASHAALLADLRETPVIGAPQ